MIASRLRVAIKGSGAALPTRTVFTRDLVAEAFPDIDETQRRRLEERSGIETRRWLGPGETATTLGSRALRQALERANLDARDLRRVIFVSSTGGDQLVPATAHGLVAAMELSDTCDAFDMSNSCVGFLSAFDVAARSVATGVGPVAVVAVETFSRLLSPQGPRAYVVLGDAAAAAILVPAERGGVLAAHLRASDRLRGKMSMAIPGTPGARPYHDFDARSAELAESAVGSIGAAIEQVLSRAELTLDEIEWIVIHQPNGSLLQFVIDRLGIAPEKTLNVVREIGSVGSVSVPFCLDRLLRERPVTAGQRILMASVGAGTAYGAVLYEVGA